MRLKEVTAMIVSLTALGFYSKLVRLKVCLSLSVLWLLSLFLFQIGAIKSQKIRSVIEQQALFLFQIGAIKRLLKNNINMIAYLYSDCKGNFYFDRIKGMSAVDLQ